MQTLAWLDNNQVQSGEREHTIKIKKEGGMPRISSKPRIVFKQQITREVHFKIRVSDEIINRLAREEESGRSGDFMALRVHDGCLLLCIDLNKISSKGIIPNEIIPIPTDKEVVRLGRGATDSSFWLDGKVMHVVFYHCGRERIVKPSKAA